MDKGADIKRDYRVLKSFENCSFFAFNRV